MNQILNRTGAPAFVWLLCLSYVCYLLNHTAHCSLGWHTHLDALDGSTPDISALLRFHFWEEVYCLQDDQGFPSESDEIRGHVVGIAEHVGDCLTYIVLTDETQQLIYR